MHMWSSRQQHVVALSTSEAEISSLLEVGKDVVWLRRLMHELGTPIDGPTPLLEDSRAAIKWTSESASWSKTRHIDTAFHKLREWKASGVIDVEYVHTSAQRADVFTKALPPEAHSEMTRHILGEMHSPYCDKSRLARAPAAA